MHRCEYVCLLKLLPSPENSMPLRVHWSEEDETELGQIRLSHEPAGPSWPLHLFEAGLASIVVPADGEAFREGEGRWISQALDLHHPIG